MRLRALTHIVDAILFKKLRIWEPEVSSFLANVNGELFVDVGACFGRYTILLSENYKQVIAIEPEPRNMQILRANVKYAGLTNVQFLQCAVSDKDGHADLYLSSCDGCHTLCVKEHKRKVRVKTLTLASILRDRCVDLVKVDVEGAELLALKGVEPVVDKIKSWVVELHNLESKKELKEWFITHGYSIRWIEPNHIYA